MKIDTIVTSVAEVSTLAGTVAWLEDLAELGQPLSLELIDGAQAYPTGYPEFTISSFFDSPARPTLKELATWLTVLESLGIPLDTTIEDGVELAVDLATQSVEPIGCGDCTRLDLLVNVHSH